MANTAPRSFSAAGVAGPAIDTPQGASGSALLRAVKGKGWNEQQAAFKREGDDDAGRDEQTRFFPGPDSPAIVGRGAGGKGGGPGNAIRRGI